MITCENVDHASNSAAYITLLGNDTLAVEKFEKSNRGITAQVVLRSPRTTLTSYELITNETGGIEELTVKNHTLDSGFNSDGVVERSYKKSGDSLVVSVKADDGSYQIQKYPYESGVLPFIDMVHWPFEVAFNNAIKVAADSIDQRLISGSRTSTFIVAKINPDSMTIRHPSRGVMGVQVDENGNILELDASATTRKLTVKRVNDVDINSIASRFAKSDKNGNPFGSLSGAVEESFTVNGVDVEVSYGSPQKRGRELFGEIVPFGKRWRTGANRATHFKISKDIKIQDLNVPAGEYTLFTIPEADGGTLIINKQTGQNGQTYDESRDLGRVEMTVREQEESVEGFTIIAEEKGNNGILKLMWGTTVYSIDFGIN
tara:strand:- start:2348 stop:3469 length:1122 start_codon:yes stop_codon:yes gene_type:complete